MKRTFLILILVISMIVSLAVIVRALVKSRATPRTSAGSSATVRAMRPILQAVTAGAQPNLILTGIVKDAATGQPIAGATVSDDRYGPKPYKSGTTDSSGKYSFTTWGEEHAVVARAPGYRARREGIAVGSSGTAKKIMFLDFALVRQ
jgi:hypothetical protein